jgi:hypothetical protein
VPDNTSTVLPFVLLASHAVAFLVGFAIRHAMSVARRRRVMRRLEVFPNG